MSQSKLEKLRSKLAEHTKKREQLEGMIKKLQSQILEEESKGFRLTIEELDISYEDALRVLKHSKQLSGASNLADRIQQQEQSETTVKENSYENI